MKKPFVREAVFDNNDAASLNSEMLSEIFNLFESSTYDKDSDSFSSKFTSWGVSIRDIYDDEDEPHYLLTVGLGPFERNPSKIYTFRYCGYISISPREDRKGTIREKIGTYTIQIWLPKGSTDYDYVYLGSKLNLEYHASVGVFLGNYAMLASPFAPPEDVAAPEAE